MDFSPPPARARDSNLLPMINVVFLLLIFFLISAQLTPPEPFAVTPPTATPQDEAAPDFTLHLSADDRFGFAETISTGPEGDAGVIAALVAERDRWCAAHDCVAMQPRLFLRADGAVSVARVAALLPLVGGAGFAQLDLVTQAGEDAP